MGQEEERKKRMAESLGWLTESSIMPRKQRPIEGVGPSSILELKAQLYQSQEESRKSKELNGPDVEYQRAKQRISAHDPLSVKNAGVEARAHKDKLELKAVKDGSASYSALEKKAELYEKLVRGELSDEEDKEKYCVDFFRKGVEEPDKEDARDTSATANLGDANCETDVPSVFNNKFVKAGRTAGVVDRDEHKRIVKEVHEEANQARAKVTEVKQLRQEQAAARREKLRKAYLLKQLEKLKAASNTQQT